MARQSRYDLANLVLGGDLEQTLLDARAKNIAFDDIALSLRIQGVEVSGETVRQWCIALSPAPEGVAK